MVSDGYYYALALAGAAVLVGWLAGPVWAQESRQYMGGFEIEIVARPVEVGGHRRDEVATMLLAIDLGDGRTAELAVLALAVKPRAYGAYGAPLRGFGA